MGRGLVCGIDIGGTGSRLAVAARTEIARALVRLDGPQVEITTAGSNLEDVSSRLAARAWAAAPGLMRRVDAVCVGATGLASLIADPAGFAQRFRASWPDVTSCSGVALSSSVGGARPPVAVPASRSGHTEAVRVRVSTVPAVPDASDAEADSLGAPVGDRASGPAVVVAVDAATAHAGALSGREGAVVALGTGAVALGTDWAAIWRRVDGWGHLLGDRGGGAWVGIRALSAAMRTFDGVDGSGAALLAAATAQFGQPPTWPRQLYTRDDRAAILAGFATDVAACADSGDEVATAILARAGREAACSAVAALGQDLPAYIGVTGGLMRNRLVRKAFADAIAHLRPDAQIASAAGDPLAGAVVLAARAATLLTREGYVWVVR